MIMTKKIHAIIVKKMVKVKNPARGFSPTFSNGGKTPQDFFKKINIKICSRNKFV